MYFAATKTITLLGMPLALASLGILLALLLSWRSPWASRVFLLLSLAMLIGLGNGLVAERLMDILESQYPRPPESVRADAAVVLAGTVDVDRSTRDRVEFYDRPERIVEGAGLVLTGRAKWLVLSGGNPDPERPDVAEADFLAAFARRLGVEAGAMVLQRESRTTAEDAVKTAEFLERRGIGSFFLVTSAFHMPRAVACFRKAGMNPIAYPVDFRGSSGSRGFRAYVPTAQSLYNSTLAIHEFIGYGAYRLLGYL